MAVGLSFDAAYSAWRARNHREETNEGHRRIAESAEACKRSLGVGALKLIGLLVLGEWSSLRFPFSIGGCAFLDGLHRFLGVQA